MANAWLKAGRPEDIAAFKEIFDEARSEGLKHAKDFEKLDCKDTPLGDESRRFNIDSQEIFDNVTRKADKAETTVVDAWRDVKSKIK